MSPSKIVAGLLVAAIAGFALWMSPGFISVETYEEVPLALPQSWRLHYLNQVFQNPTEDCAGCYNQLVGTLQALAHHPELGAGFDYAGLLPLLRNGAGYIREPVPQLACSLILARRAPKLYGEMAIAFRGDPDSLESCVVSTLGTLRQFKPAEYESISKVLLETPELSKYVGPKGS